MIAVGYVRPDKVSGRFAEALVTLALAGRMTDGWIGIQSGPRIASARNEVVDYFLDHKSAPYLLMVDTDMDFTVEHVDQLLAIADDETILGGLCFTGDVNISPTLYRMVEEDGKLTGSEPIWNYPPDALVEVDATGAAFLLIPRNVLQTMRDAFMGRTAYPYFAESERDLVGIGEDVTFCLRARGLGFKVKVDTGCRIGHAKTRLIDQGSYLSWRRDYTEANA